MQVVSIEGAVPGLVMATVRHGEAVRSVSVEIARHPAGGWQARHSDSEWTPRCRAVDTAILMDASEAFLLPN